MISPQLKLCSGGRRMIGPCFTRRSCAIHLPFVPLGNAGEETPSETFWWYSYLKDKQCVPRPVDSSFSSAITYPETLSHYRLHHLLSLSKSEYGRTRSCVLGHSGPPGCRSFAYSSTRVRRGCEERGERYQTYGRGVERHGDPVEAQSIG